MSHSTPSSACLCLLLPLFAACSSDGAPPASSSSSATAASARASALAAATSSAPASASAARGAPKAPAAKAPDKDQRASFLKHLNEGRRLSQKKDFAAALVELEAALAVSPKDARALGEVGWAAFGKRDLVRARSATTLGLAHTSEPKLRAQLLYTRGRAAQEAGDKDAARRDYAESLTLRDNAEVAKRFAEVGGTPEEITPAWSTCTEGFASVAELCGCLEKRSATILTLEGKASCEAAPQQDLGDPRLSVVRLSTGEIGYEAALILVAKDDVKLRAVAELGREYEPGAFGVHNTAEVKGGKLVAKGRVAAIHHLQANDDYNMAGLELCQEHAEYDTLCVLGQGGVATVCPRTIPVELTTGCGPGVEVDPAELGPEEAAEVARIKAGATRSTTKLSWAIDDAGKLSVKVSEGDAAAVPKAVLAESALLPAR